MMPTMFEVLPLVTDKAKITTEMQCSFKRGLYTSVIC